MSAIVAAALKNGTVLRYVAELPENRRKILYVDTEQSHIIGCLSFLLLKTSDTFRKAVHSIIRFARDYYKPRFDTEQVSDIKNALNLFGDDRQSHQAAGDFLYFTARQKGEFDNREQIKARREVDNVVEGNYDQQKRGFTMRR
uniref:Uncharacterized protein n=1 Tax=uncultured bacterium 4L05 TaxID=1701371 RepID=A0A0M4BT38_9BACT|nr:hypothetical protein [uncultured bacterium 4L05]